MVRKTIVGALAAAFVGLAAPLAQAAHVPGITFTPGPFVVDPTAVGETPGPFSATFITFNYQAEADQTGVTPVTGTFDETGGASFLAFANSLNPGGEIDADVSGLNLNYDLYALFTGSGTVVNNLAGGIDGTFLAFDISVFVDPDENTTFNDVTAGAPDESVMTTGGTGDDVLVLTGTLLVGGFHVFDPDATIVTGDFDVQFTVTGCGDAPGFFCGPGGLAPGDIGDINGVNTSIDAEPPFVLGAGDTRTDIVIDGSGNVSFLQQVPEPGSLALLGLGVALLGMGLRRRNSA